MKKKFSFKLSSEKIKEFKHLTAKQKLKWLEEANLFLQKALTQKQKKKWAELREGHF